MLRRFRHVNTADHRVSGWARPALAGSAGRLALERIWYPEARPSADAGLYGAGFVFA